MYNIIGLGGAGCNVAEKFENIENYNVKLVDTGIEGDENCISIPELSSHEEYEKHFPNLEKNLADIKENVLLITAGSGDISGGSLKLLNQLKHCNISLLYLRPELELLGTNEKLQERITYNVFQQYSRSGVFKEIYLVSNSELEKILGDLPILNFNDKLNDLIFSCFSNIKLFDNTDPVIDSSVKKEEYSRISTFGVYDLENNIEKLFFPLDYVDTKIYYICVPKDRLTNDGNLRKIIRENMREKLTDITKIGYKIFSHENSDRIFGYVMANSRKIQE